MRALTAREVADSMGPREFSYLCGKLDEAIGEKKEKSTLQGSGWNDNLMFVAGSTTAVRFDVLEITRPAFGQLVVTVSIDPKIEITMDLSKMYKPIRGKAKKNVA